MSFERITSRKNETVVRVCSLRQRKYRQERRLFIAEGTTLYFEAKAQGIHPVSVFVSDRLSPRDNADFFDSIKKEKHAKLYSVPDEVYEKMSGEDAPAGALCVYGFLGEKPAGDAGLYLLCERLQDPGNVGAILRSARAFGVRGVLLCGCADVYNEKTVRASMGAVFSQPFFVFDGIGEAFAFARERCRAVYGTALHAQSVPLGSVRLSDCCAVIGNEGSGVSEEALRQCDGNITVPIRGIQSLNAAVAASIIMYAASLETFSEGS